MTKRTTFTSIAFSLAIVSIAQVTVGPGARFTWVDAPSEFKLGYGLHVSVPVDSVLRLNVEGYWTPWEDVYYLHQDPGAFGSPGPRFERLYEYTNWGLSVDLERNMGRAWFLSAGLVYTSFHTEQTDVVTDDGSSESTLQEHWDRLLALNLGFGKRWRIGPGELRTAIAAGVIGYNFENDNDHFPACETYGVSVSYQVRIGGKP